MKYRIIGTLIALAVLVTLFVLISSRHSNTEQESENPEQVITE